MTDKKIPFDEDMMTIIMGLGGPEEPGQHGRKMIPAPQQSAIELITQIKDMCEDFLMTADKERESEKEAMKNDEMKSEEDSEE